MNRFIYNVRASVTLLLFMTVLLGGIYPLSVTLIAQGIFPNRANGSLIDWSDRTLGSSLLGQQFEHPKYFWGRLSATMPPYNPAASAGSNLSPSNPKLLEAANVRIAALQKAEPTNKAPIPVDLVTASGSGLDPHISVEAMRYQLARVAKARGMKMDAVESFAAKATIKPFLGVFGEPYVDVMKLNLSLDESSK
jgi:K+-transporting ATPase ATPase C chain